MLSAKQAKKISERAEFWETHVQRLLEVLTHMDGCESEYWVRAVDAGGKDTRCRLFLNKDSKALLRGAVEREIELAKIKQTGFASRITFDGSVPEPGEAWSE